jgi:hypothetical protein
MSKYFLIRVVCIIIKVSCIPGLTRTSIKSMCGVRAATTSAKHPPKELPNRYMRLLGQVACSFCHSVFYHCDKF